MSSHTTHSHFLYARHTYSRYFGSPFNPVGYDTGFFCVLCTIRVCTYISPRTLYSIYVGIPYFVYIGMVLYMNISFCVMHALCVHIRIMDSFMQTGSYHSCRPTILHCHKVQCQHFKFYKFYFTSLLCC